MVKKPLYERVAIVGVGLIGGSIGMAVKRKGLARWVVGVARHRRTVAEAFGKRAADVVTLDVAEGVAEADLVILCAPVFTILTNFRQIAPHLKRGAVVIDVGSTKVPILAAAKKYLKRNAFVGCHPMAGSEKCGIENADARLFENAVCFTTSRHAGVDRFWRAIGARPVFVDARTHDAWVARMSHLPHVLSFALFHRVPRMPGRFSLNPSAAMLARLARSNPALWAEILTSNRAEVRPALRELYRALAAFAGALGKPASLRRLIKKANRTAASFLE